MTPKSWNTLQTKDGKRTQIHGGWINYLDSLDRWTSLDSGFLEDGNGYSASRIPGVFQVPRLAHQPSILEVSQRYDIWTKSRILEPSISLEMTPEGVSPVAAQRDDQHPDRIVYPDAFERGVDLRYTIWLGKGPRATREVVIRSIPAGDLDLHVSWRLRSTDLKPYVTKANGVVKPAWSGKVTDQASILNRGIILKGGMGSNRDSMLRGAGIRTPYAWYYTREGELVRTPIQVKFRLVKNDTVRATKVIPRWFILQGFAAGASAVMADDTHTFYSDANAESTTTDGWVQHSGGAPSWSGLRGGIGSARSDSGTSLQVWCSSWYGTGQYSIMQRSVLLFDTSSLSGMSISEASLTATATGTRSNTLSTTNFGIGLVASDPASNTSLANTDYPLFEDTRFCDTDVLHANPMSGTKLWDFNASGIAAIDTEGITKLGLRHEWDIDDSETWKSGSSDYVYFYSADQSGTGSDPVLTVEAAAADTSTRAMAALC